MGEVDMGRFAPGSTSNALEDGGTLRIPSVERRGAGLSVAGGRPGVLIGDFTTHLYPGGRRDQHINWMTMDGFAADWNFHCSPIIDWMTVMEDSIEEHEALETDLLLLTTTTLHHDYSNIATLHPFPLQQLIPTCGLNSLVSLLSSVSKRSANLATTSAASAKLFSRPRQALCPPPKGMNSYWVG